MKLDLSIAYESPEITRICMRTFVTDESWFEVSIAILKQEQNDPDVVLDRFDMAVNSLRKSVEGYQRMRIDRAE